MRPQADTPTECLCYRFAFYSSASEDCNRTTHPLTVSVLLFLMGLYILRLRLRFRLIALIL